MSPEELLFQDRRGKRIQLEDLIDEGLDEDYSDRIPELVRLLEEGESAHRLAAAVVLASWGVAAGLEAVISWARQGPPWASGQAGVERLFGEDDTFARLADALRTSRLLGRADPALRQQAVEALLSIYERRYFGRSLANLLLMDPALAEACEGAVAQAAERALRALDEGKGHQDMALQIAALIGPLARFSDERATALGRGVLGRGPRVARELAAALAEGRGRGTRELLEELQRHPDASVREEARKALVRHREAA